MHILSEYELHSISQQTILTLPMESAGKVARLAHSSMPNASHIPPCLIVVSKVILVQLSALEGIPHESNILISFGLHFFMDQSCGALILYVLRYIGTVDRERAHRDNQTHNISMHIE
jgi:hypothetical protein